MMRALPNHHLGPFQTSRATHPATAQTLRIARTKPLYDFFMNTARFLRPDPGPHAILENSGRGAVVKSSGQMFRCVSDAGERGYFFRRSWDRRRSLPRLVVRAKSRLLSSDAK